MSPLFSKLHCDGFICKFLTNNATTTIVATFIMSRIDYYDLSLFGFLHDFFDIAVYFFFISAAVPSQSVSV